MAEKKRVRAKKEFTLGDAKKIDETVFEHPEIVFADDTHPEDGWKPDVREASPREKKYRKSKTLGARRGRGKGQEVGTAMVESGFALEIPDWITCREETYKKIAKTAALQMAGLTDADISRELGVTPQYMIDLQRRYPTEFAEAQKKMIQHAAIQLGVNLFAFRAALLDVVPDCIDHLGRLVRTVETNEKIRLEAIKLVLRMSGIAMAQATPLEEQVRKELSNFIRGAAIELGIGSSVEVVESV